MYCSIREFNEYDFNGNLDSIKEVIYHYNKSDLMEKLKMTKDLDIGCVFAYEGVPNEDDLKEINDLLDVRPNIKIMFYGGRGAFLPEGKRPKGNFFYSFATLTVDNFDMLKPVLKTGVSDIYIAGLLGFSMKTVKDICEEYETSIRVVPNLATISGIANSINEDDITSFWIRPEDLEFYDKYIDIIEFDCENEKQSVYYDIYFQDKKWGGNLSEIICGNVNVKNKGLTINFGEFRANCNKKCVFNLCHKCHKMVALAEMLVDNSLEAEESI